MFIYEYTSKETLDRFNELMLGEKPVWISRFAGSDTALVQQHYLYKKIPEILINNLKNYNGYFDKNNDMNILLKFIDMYNQSIYNADFLTIVTMKRVIYGSDNTRYVVEILKDKEICNYAFIESVKPFLESFKTWGEKKKILIISPFSESLRFQTQKHRINKILKNYVFPDCEFLFFDMPVTYNSDKNSNNTVFK